MKKIVLMLVMVFIFGFTDLLHSSADYSNFKGRGNLIINTPAAGQRLFGKRFNVYRFLYNLWGITQSKDYMVDAQ